MKRVLSILAILIAVVVAAFAIFLATFDADRFRPQVITELEKATGQPVALERISLGWRGGLALQLKGLTITDRTAPSAAPLLHVDQASAVVSLMPLLRREVQVAAVILTRPEVRISRALDGSINVVGLAVAGSPAAAARPPAASGTGAGAAPNVAISSVKITDGQLQWTDALKGPLTQLTVRDIDVTLRNIAPAQPLDIEAQVALFGEQQNLKVSGRILPPLGAQAGVIENLKLEIDLGRMRWEEVRGAFPAIQQAEVKQVQGVLQVSVERLPLSAEGLNKAAAHVTLSNGRAELAQFPQPVEQIQLSATLSQGRAEIAQASAGVAGGTVQFSGRIEGLGQPTLRTTFKATLNQLPLEMLQAHPRPQDPYLKARCTLALEGKAEGPAAQLLSSLSGQGQLNLQEPVLVNINILKEVFQKLSMLPGLMQRLQARLPEEYQQKFEAKDTVFETIDAPLRIQAGAIHFERLPIRTEAFRLDNAGLIALQGGVNIQSMLSIEPALSEALIRSVNEMQTLTTPQGELQIPLVIQGRMPHVQISPDINYVASRLIQTKVQDFLGDLLQKHLGPEEETAPSPEAPATP